MRSKQLIWILAFLILGSIAVTGYLLYDTYPVTFYLVQGIVLVELVLFVLIYKDLIKPYKALSDGVTLMREQDFATRLRTVNNPDANRLIDVFNHMMEQLRSERQMIRQRNHFLDLLIDASPLGLVTFDYDGRIDEINPAGLRLLKLTNLDQVKNKTLEESGNEMLRQIAIAPPEEYTILRKNGYNTYRVFRSTFLDRGFNRPFVFIEELTGEILKAERKSYENILRVMSHEVNNSVGAISSTLNVLQDIAASDDSGEWSDVRTALDASASRCVSLTRFVQNLASVVKIPEPCYSNVSLNELAQSVAALTYHDCKSRRIRQTLRLAPLDITLRLDGIQFEQILINIIKNACESIGHDGEIRIVTTNSPATITIEDNGPGITEDVKQKLFTPFFTTKATGHGIGLMFVREVLLNHNFSFNFDSRDGWTRFQIRFEKN